MKKLIPIAKTHIINSQVLQFFLQKIAVEIITKIGLNIINKYINKLNVSTILKKLNVRINGIPKKYNVVNAKNIIIDIGFNTFFIKISY